MVKKRQPQKATQDSDSFIKGAVTQTATQADQPAQSGDPRAPHTDVSVSLKMNQYTYDLLLEASKLTERSLVGTMRVAIQKYAKAVIKENS